MMDRSGSTYMTLVTTQRKRTPMYGPMMYTSVTREYSPMSETIKISPCNDRIRDVSMKYSIALVLLVTLLSLTMPAVWAAQSDPGSTDKLLPFDPSEIDNALTAPPNVPNELQDLANTF